MLRPSRLALGAAVLLGATACGSAGSGVAGTTASGGGTETVKLRVVSGPHNATLALAPVYIDGKGPFVFALDTGASVSLVSQPVVQKLGLEATGKHEVSGVACTTKAAQLHLTNWRVGNVTLPAKTVDTVSLPGPGQKLQGLLGSDVLSTFGSIQVDYDRQVLILRPHAHG